MAHPLSSNREHFYTLAIMLLILTEKSITILLYLHNK